MLIEFVAEEELQNVLHGFQKGKILRSYGWFVESFLGFNWKLGRDLLEVMEESQSIGKICPLSYPISLLTFP